MDDNKSIVSCVFTVFAFLALAVLSSCVKEQHRSFNAKEAYVACVNAQKSTAVDMKCGQDK